MEKEVKYLIRSSSSFSVLWVELLTNKLIYSKFPGGPDKSLLGIPHIRSMADIWVLLLFQSLQWAFKGLNVKQQGKSSANDDEMSNEVN